MYGPCLVKANIWPHVQVNLSNFWGESSRVLDHVISFFLLTKGQQIIWKWQMSIKMNPGASIAYQSFKAELDRIIRQNWMENPKKITVLPLENFYFWPNAVLKKTNFSGFKKYKICIFGFLKIQICIFGLIIQNCIFGCLKIQICIFGLIIQLYYY